MKEGLHILNALIAFPAFFFYNAFAGKRLARWLPLVLVILSNIIACSFLFYKNVVLNAIELNMGFLLVYVALHYRQLQKRSKSQDQETENLLLEKEDAEMEALQLQLQPHFLFNALNTLHHLIKPADKEARNYVQHLADVYRYMLKNKTKELVLLGQELEFSRHFIYLLNIRYREAIHVRITIDEQLADNYLVMPVSLQILVENAIKHNHFTGEEPLELLISMNEQCMIVQNKTSTIIGNKMESLQIGLKNLSDRSVRITDKPLIIATDGGSFTVQIPLIKFK